MLNSSTVIQKVNGLNSKSTFNRWRKLAEDLCNSRFKQEIIKVGQTSYTKVYLYSEKDVECFQKVSDLKNKGHPLNEAILQSFSMKDFKKKTTIVETSSLSLENLIKNTKLANEQIIDLSNQLIQLEKS